MYAVFQFTKGRNFKMKIKIKMKNIIEIIIILFLLIYCAHIAILERDMFVGTGIIAFSIILASKIYKIYRESFQFVHDIFLDKSYGFNISAMAYHRLIRTLHKYINKNFKGITNILIVEESIIRDDDVEWMVFDVRLTDGSLISVEADFKKRKYFYDIKEG